MQLHNAVSHGQPNPAAALLGGEIKIEDFVADGSRYSGSGVLDFDLRLSIVAMRPQRKRADIFHGLRAVNDDVQERLLHQVHIHLRRQRLVGDLRLQMYAVPLAIRLCHKCDLLDQAAQVDIPQSEFDGASEVHQRLHYAVEALDFGGDYLQVTFRVGVRLFQFVPQNLEMHHNGINGILNFVRHAGGELAYIGQAAGDLDLAFNLPNRLRVAHGEQSAQLLSILFDEIQRDLDVGAVVAGNLHHVHGTVHAERAENAAAELRMSGEDLLGMLAQHLAPRLAKEGLDGGAYQHCALIAREQHQAILQVGHDLIDILLQGREDFIDGAHLPPNAFDL